MTMPASAATEGTTTAAPGGLHAKVITDGSLSYRKNEFGVVIAANILQSQNTT